MDGKVQSADDRLNRQVKGLLARRHRAFDPGMAAPGDKNKPEASDVHHERPLGDPAKPEQHAVQRGQHCHARSDHLRG